MSIKLIITEIENNLIFESDAFIPTNFSYFYFTPSTSQAKSIYQQAYLLIQGHINPNVLDPHPVLPLWANIIWTPKNGLSEYYRDVQVIETRFNQILRSIHFSKASVVSYREQSTIENSLIQFSLLLRQKIDCMHEIKINVQLPFKQQNNINSENSFDPKTTPITTIFDEYVDEGTYVGESDGSYDSRKLAAVNKGKGSGKNGKLTVKEIENEFAKAAGFKNIDELLQAAEKNGSSPNLKKEGRWKYQRGSSTYGGPVDCLLQLQINII